MDGVAGWFEARGEIPLVRPAGVREYGPLADDPVRLDAYLCDGAASGIAFAMEYCDARGWASTRTIRCFGLDPGPPATLRAFCNVRGAVRCFRIDRIISILDLSSGRMLSGDEHVSLLAPYLEGVGAAPDIAALQALQKTARSGVFALLHLAMSDGRLGDKPRAIVHDYIRAEAEVSHCPLPSGEMIELWVNNLAPPLDAVIGAVNEMLAEKDKFVRLLPWLLKIVRAQNDFAAQEESVRQLIAEVRLHFRRKLLDRPANRRAIS